MHDRRGIPAAMRERMQAGNRWGYVGRRPVKARDAVAKSTARAGQMRSAA